MLPPNYIGSLDNLARAGIIDYGTAAYVARDRPSRYSRLLNPCNPYYNQYDSFCYSQNPFYGNYQRRSFWRTVGTAILALGGVYCGGKIFLSLAKGVKSFSLKNIFSSRKAKKAAQTASQKTKKGGLFRRGRKNAAGTANTAGTAGRQAAATGTQQVTGTTGNGTTFFSRIGNSLSGFFSNIKSKAYNVFGMTKRTYSSLLGKFRPTP